MASSFDDRKKAMADRNEIEEPRSQLTEREPLASGPLLATYDAVARLDVLRTLGFGIKV